MRLLVITNIYPPQNLGGFGLCIERITNGLKDIGYSEIVLTANLKELGKVNHEESINRNLRLLGSYENGVQHIKDPIEREKRQSLNIKLIEDTIAKHKPDVCLLGNLDLLGKEILDKVLEYKIPTVQHIGFMGSPFEGDWLPSQRLFRLAFASGEVKRLFTKMGHKVEKGRVIYPPLADNRTHISNRTYRRQTMRIGFCGLIMESKGLHIAIIALRNMIKKGYSIKMDIAGKSFSKRYEENLREYCRINKIAEYVEWKGFIEPNNIGEFYRDIDFLIFPSLYPESFGMVVAEAMSYGVIPVSTGVGGAYEVITHEVDGLLVNPGDIEDLEKTLEWCIKNESKIDNIGRRAKKSAEKRFLPKVSAENMNRMYLDMISKKN